MTTLSEDEKPTPLHFKVSSGLKRVIGRDLITDEFVAIFELVKNSFDANATRVDLLFEGDRLLIMDNGKGMSYRDLTEKWLFVAYSAKREGIEDIDYRDRIGADKAYAGSKGVGRFSCDTLGEKLLMQTRKADSRVEVINVQWDLFERDATDQFGSVPIIHSTASDFVLPVGYKSFTTGTILEIGALREGWDREKLLRLRAALAKLINPFGGTADGFEVRLNAPSELAQDIEEQNKRKDEIPIEVRTVNGPVKNFIFDTLKGKTTHLEVSVSLDGMYLYSTLTDRGALIYKIRERNTKFLRLKDAGFSCNLFYLNRSAKMTFKRQMGVNSVQFGSIFLFKNGFRIFPIGEEGVDTFGIDRRKAQGYNRFLGTRDVIGRIDVVGSDEKFRESTSRDQGLIETPAYIELEECFDEKCFRRLERYVVGVNWRDALDLDADDSSRLRGDSASARITAIVSQLAGSEGVELLDYNRELVRILNERSESFNDVLGSLRVLAERSADQKLLNEISAASKRFSDLQRAEVAAREAADRERQVSREALRTASEAVLRADTAKKAFEEERKRSLFLTSLTSLDRETVEILHHQIIIHSAAINEIINGQFDQLRDGVMPTRDDLFSTLENLSFQNKKVLSTARFATKANFRLDSESIDEDLSAYFVDYVNQVAPLFSESGIKIGISSSAKSFVRRFKPIEVSILVDNLVSNAGKADATEIQFTLDQPGANELRVLVQDDGRGLSADIADMSRIFEKGFTTSTGSGLGLYHVSQILDDMGGAISIEPSERGARFIIRIRG